MLDAIADIDRMTSSLDKQFGGTGKAAPVRKTRAALELEAEGWRVWLPTMGPKTFRGEFASFHADYWDWLWPLLRAKQRGESIAGFAQFLSYLLLLGRGNAKSSTMEWSVIAAGALIGPMAAVYTSSTEGLASEHLTAIQHRVESKEFESLYPGLAQARVGKYGARAGWNKNVLKTQSGLTVYAVGLNQDVRGLKDLDLRIGLEIFDDFDSRDDSPDVVKKKEGQIGGTILPMGTPETINVMGQNIIHENSVANRTHLRHNDLLNHRKESGIIPAFTNVEIEQQGSRHVILSGAKANWKYFDMLAAQKFLDDSGPLHFFAEYQHEFDRQKQGLVFSNYDDDVHVITKSQFAAVFGTREIPPMWNKYMGHDWARTKDQYHACVVSQIAVSDQNTALPGRVFLYNVETFEANTEPDDVALRILQSLSPLVPSLNGSPSNTTWEELIKYAVSREHLEQYVTSTTDLINKRRALLAKVVPEYARAALRAQNFRTLVMSHEASGPSEVYSTSFGLNFDPVNPGKTGGIDMLHYTMKVEKDKPHSFKDQMGDTRFFIVVDESQEKFTDALKPDLLHGLMLARYQFKHWRYLEPKLTSQGVEERGPQKMNDDVGQSLQMIWNTIEPRARELSTGEKIQAAIPQQYRREEMLKSSPYENGLTPQQELTHAFQQDLAKRKLAGSGIRHFSVEYN